MTRRAAHIQCKRVTDPVSPEDGQRLLVDRLWPRGVSKAQAQLTAWRKDLAPSTALRQWFGHDPARWNEFRRRYRAELTAAGKGPELHALAVEARRTPITLVFAAADREHNNAAALGEWLRELDQERRT